MVDVTVITPSLPTRSDLLAEAMATVTWQTAPPAAHLIGVDHGKRGPAAVRNELLAGVETEWVLFLDDDDLLDSHCLQVLLAESAGAHVVIPYCRFDGPAIPPKYHNRPFDRAALREHGIFPITVLANTRIVRAVGGFPQARYEDWEMWNAIADTGARFKVVPQILWTYRMGHGNRTHDANAA